MSFFSDDEHFSHAGQLIEAQYELGLLNAAAVPDPTVGAGLHGAILAFGGWLGWMRRREATLAA